MGGPETSKLGGREAGVGGEMMRLHLDMVGVHPGSATATNCVASGRTLDLSGPQFSPLKSENKIKPLDRDEGFKQIMHEKQTLSGCWVFAF